MSESYSNILSFLENVDKDFPVPLSEKQNLSEYSEKLCRYATICCIKKNNRILAAVIGYTNDIESRIAYIAVVATLSSERGHGYATQCLCKFIEKCRMSKMDCIHLYTSASNILAINMYKNIGFIPFQMDNEPRPDDIHLIYKINNTK